jgi:hypothetical protein
MLVRLDLSHSLEANATNVRPRSERLLEGTMLRLIANRVLKVVMIVLLAVLSIRAEVTLPTVIAEYMVVQRGLAVHMWGKAAPGGKVRVTFRATPGQRREEP